MKRELRVAITFVTCRSEESRGSQRSSTSSTGQHSTLQDVMLHLQDSEWRSEEYHGEYDEQHVFEQTPDGEGHGGGVRDQQVGGDLLRGEEKRREHAMH
jgi:hypothetical protein